MAHLTDEVSVTWLPGAHGPRAADRLLASEVSRVSGIAEADLHIGRSCKHCGSTSHGRPVVSSSDAPFVSLGRADGLVLVAVSAGARVGIDVERSDASGFPGFAAVALHPLETASGPEELTTLWVRKEALLKATGDGLRLDPARIRISDGTASPRLLEWPQDPMPVVHLHDLELDGYAACLAVLGDQTPRVTVRQAGPAALGG